MSITFEDILNTGRRFANNTSNSIITMIDSMDYVAPLTVGSTGQAVSWTQRALKRLGFCPSDNCNKPEKEYADGDFGQGTLRAVIAFQKDRNLKLVDGIVGPVTWQALGGKYSPVIVKPNPPPYKPQPPAPPVPPPRPPIDDVIVDPPAPKPEPKPAPHIVRDLHKYKKIGIALGAITLGIMAGAFVSSLADER